MISIITPTYNHEKFIGQCIDSVLAQTCRDWEMIIIDDGSTDGTGDVARMYKDERIRYVRQENKGIGRLSETYNAALSMAKGDCIAILEGDDYWPPDKLESQAGDFRDKDVVLSFGYTQIVTHDGMPVKLIPPKDFPSEAKTNEPIGRASLYMMNPSIFTYTFPVSVMMRKETLCRIGGFQQPSYLPLVDYPTFLCLTLEGRFAFHEKILGFWRRHGESATKSRFYLIVDGVHKHIKSFQSKNSVRLPLTDKEKRWIDSEWDQFEAMRCLTLGRWHMVDGEWSKARTVFRKGLPLSHKFMLSMSLKSGILLSYIHLNMEFLFYVRKKQTIDAMISSSDLTVSKEM